MCVHMFVRVQIMFTLSSLDFYNNKPKRLIVYLQRLRLLQESRCMCPHCGDERDGRLFMEPCSRYMDWYRFRCDKCNDDFSVRYNSIFARSRQPLLICCRLLALSRRALHCHSNQHPLVNSSPVRQRLLLVHARRFVRLSASKADLLRL